MYGSEVSLPGIAAALNEFGRSHSLEDNNSTALEFYKNEMAMYKQLQHNEEYSVYLADANQRIGSCYNEMNCHEESQRHMQQALDMYRKIYQNEKSHEDIATILKTLGDINFKMGNHEKAEDYYSEAFEIYSDKHGSNIDHEGIAALSDALEANQQKKNS